MNKYLNAAHWLLVIIVVVSVLVAGKAGFSLWQTNKINAFIAKPGDFKDVPQHLKAQFAQAYNDAEQGKTKEVLERLTTVLETKDRDLEARAYFNRGNINLRQAKSLPVEDSARLPLIGLAKQDYRSALLIEPSLWDARFNLELALSMVPEEVTITKKYTKRKGAETRVVKAVGFRVDLP